MKSKKTRDIFPLIKKTEYIVCTQKEYELLSNHHPELWGDSNMLMYPTHLSVGVISCQRCEDCMQPELCCNSLYRIKYK